METLSARDLQIFREKSRAFCGSVKIPLDKFQPEPLPENPRQFDEENAARLLQIFEQDCQRWEPDNYVPVLIPRSALPEAPLRVGDDLQLLNPEHPLTYLHGRHRIEAARRLFTGNDRWWIANLYSDDLSEQVKNVLREHDPSSAKFFDGDTLRQIRISTIRGDSARRKKFLARLSKSKQNCVKRLEALPHTFWDSLDALIPFAGLWPAIFIGAFPRLLNLHCPEEMTRYLRRVKRTMTYIIGEDENDWLLIDANTADLIQGRCPGLSYEDRAFLQMRMISRELFPAIRDDTTRSLMFDRICSIKHVITTVHTLLEDTKYLEPCTRILKKLLPGKSKGSLSQYFNILHNGQANVRVQTAEFSSEDRTPSGLDASWVSYRVLWLLTLRHFPEMDGEAPRKDIGMGIEWDPGLEYRWWVNLSELARDNGYKRLLQLYRDYKAADLKMIKEFVERMLPSNYYKIDQELIRRKVRLIYEIIGDVPHVEMIAANPELTSDHDNRRPEISDRCGRPRSSTLLADRGYLFFDYIYSTSYDTTPKRYLTSFAITRDFFHSFFGTAADDLDRQFSLQLPRDSHVRDREDPSRMPNVEDLGPLTNLGPSLPPPPPEVSLPSNPSGPVANTRSAVTTSGLPPTQNSRSSDRKSTRRTRSASPTTDLQNSEQRRERSNSRDRGRRRDLTSTRGGDTRIRDTIFPGAVQQLLPPAPSAESTQVATTSVEEVSAENVEMIPFAAGPLADRADTAVPRSRSLGGRRSISPRGRSISPTSPQHRSERRRERSNSHDRGRGRDLTSAHGGDTRIRDTIFPGAAQQLLLAGPPTEAESTQAATVSSEDTSTEDMEIVPWVPPSVGPVEENTHTAIVPRSRSLDGRREISRGDRSASPTRPSRRLERRRERSTSSQRERRRSRGEDTSTEDMEIVPWVPPPQTAAGPLVEYGESAIISSVAVLPSTQPSAAPIFSQEIRDRAFPALPDIQLSATPMFKFSEEAQDGTVSASPAAQPSAAPTFVFSQEAQGGTSALTATQPAAASMSVLGQEIQERTISALLASKSSAGPRFVSGQKQLIEDITISLQDASRFLFRRRTRTTAQSFMVLSPTGGDRFRLRKADSANAVSMVKALQLPSEAPFLALARDPGKRLKVTAPTTILEEARSQRLDAALVVSKENSGEIIRRLQDAQESEEELPHKEPQRMTGNEIARTNTNPIEIHIWQDGDWKVAEKKVNYSQTEDRIRYFMLRVRGVRPYDWEGNLVAVEECFDAAQSDAPPTIYLSRPEDAGLIFPITI